MGDNTTSHIVLQLEACDCPTSLSIELCVHLYTSIATSILDPSPFHLVPAPISCEISEGISVRILAIHIGSVKGVRSSRFGSR